jgi:hypothetical protein
LGESFAQNIKGVFRDQEGIGVNAKDHFLDAFDLKGVDNGEDDILAFTGRHLPTPAPDKIPPARAASQGSAISILKLVRSRLI